MSIQDTLEKHLKWITNSVGGERANLSGADLSGADLSMAKLSMANLSGANLSMAKLSMANLSMANLSGANLSMSKLSMANLSGANLSMAKLSGADLSRANLSGANLSGAKGIFKLKRFLCHKRQVLKWLGFKVHKNYFVAYKVFSLQYKSPVRWKIGSGKKITERVDKDIFNQCSRGINCANKKWVEENNPRKLKVWKLKIKFDADIVIPLFSDGKIRVSEATIL